MTWFLEEMNKEGDIDGRTCLRICGVIRILVIMWLIDYIRKWYFWRVCVIYVKYIPTHYIESFFWKCHRERCSLFSTVTYMCSFGVYICKSETLSLCVRNLSREGFPFLSFTIARNPSFYICKVITGYKLLNSTIAFAGLVWEKEKKNPAFKTDKKLILRSFFFMLLNLTT